MHRLAALALLALIPASARAEIPCGGSFSEFRAAMQAEAIARGHDPAAAERFFGGLRQDPKVLQRDRAQGIFQLPFIDFSRRVISQNRIQNGRANLKTYAPIFERIEREQGVSPGVLLAFWALETDYGAVQGNFNTANALMTLSHDCRRPELFQPQVFAALTLYERGDFDPASVTGAWAGEIGMVQMLPGDILENGVDGDGDGHVSLKTSVPDALMSGAAMLRALGWRPNEPWLQEVTVPAGLDWALTGLDHPRLAADWAALGVTPRGGPLAAPGLPAALILPQGKDGPAFLAYPNFNIYFEWNQSFTYVLTAAYFATRLEGAQIYDAGNPAPGLSGEQIQALQRKLVERGHDVGGIDGILGEKTREAVQAEQLRLGMPADAWPTPAMLNAL
ncbi:lytic murein transglycosylase [Tropicimonas sp. IMCC6043]|uniref:lytic murein transglycosylase n=1 Tax=Tropicimonas sp. IMCC6043 TaxID=2510645 RepID=UPI00101D71C0|nr:lytic murein transglycosylase [Tropicimonas sp. IMCC6043]RYH11650.1 lytic murein transglycosylase [Tropicimonas sp. IMCC6043]